jgi:hypothetical protein
MNECRRTLGAARSGLGFPRRRAVIVMRELGTEAMLYDPEGDKVVRLNPTARRIWELCDGEQSVPDIAATIQNEFLLHAGADIHSDVAETVTGFAAAGLLAQA